MKNLERKLALKHSLKYETIANKSNGLIIREKYLAKARLKLKHCLRKHNISFTETERYDLNYLKNTLEEINNG